MGLKKPIVMQLEKATEDLDKAREQFIKGGGFVAADVKQQPEKELKSILIRVKQEAVDQIDSLVENSLGMTRTGWILQAIEEKLKKDSQ